MKVSQQSNFQLVKVKLKDSISNLERLFMDCFEGMPDNPGYFEGIIGSENGIVVSCAEGGFALGWKISDRIFFIDSLGVTKDKRGKGIGTALLKRISAIAMERFAVTSITLNVEPENFEAIALLI